MTDFSFSTDEPHFVADGIHRDRPKASVTVEDDRFIVKSPFSMKDALKEIPGRMWSKPLRAWTYPITDRAAYSIIFALVTGGCDIAPILPELQAGADRWIMGAAILNDDEAPPIPEVRTKPFAHQEKGLRLIRARSGSYLAWEMGTGKTKAVIDAVETIDEVRRVLIVCPLSIISVWQSQWKIHGRDAQIVALDHGSIQDRNTRLFNLFQIDRAKNRTIVGVINYEAVWRSPFGSWAKGQEWDMIVCDEIHRIKASRGRASTFMGELAPRGARRVGLTGTPMPAGPMDLWAQCRFVDAGIFGSFYTVFRTKYAVMGGYKNKQVVNFRNLDDLKKRFYSIAHRVTKEEVLDLPDQTHVEIEVGLSAEARKVYDEIESSFIARIEQGEITVSNALVELLRLQQVTGGAATTDDGTIHEVCTAKHDALRDFFMDLPLNEPVVMFARFIHDLDVIHRAAAAAGRTSIELSGRRKELDQWQRADAQPTILASQIQTGGLGVDMTRARYCGFYSLGFSLGDYEQALARTHRQGQTRNVTYVHFIARDTVDRKVYSALTRKARVVEAVLEGLNISPGGREHEHQNAPIV